MANARKLPSGQYRTRQYAGLTPDGKRFYVSFTASTKLDSQRGAAELVVEWRRASGQPDKPDKITLREAAERYVSNRHNVLSPPTRREYRRMASKYMQAIMDKPVNEIRSEHLQAAVDAESGRLSPKTVRNIYAFVTSAIKSVDEDARFKVRLPQRRKVKYYDAEDSDVQRLMTAACGTSLETAIGIAAFTGMRRSEIAALKREDIDVDNHVIHVCRAMVKNDDKTSKDRWVVKGTKNTESERDIDVSDYEIEYMLSHDSGKEYLLGIRPSSITRMFDGYKKRLNLKIRFHDLRSYNVSIMHMLGLPDKVIIRRTGHATSHIMNRVYNRVTQGRVKLASEVAREHFDAVLRGANTANPNEETTTMHHENAPQITGNE